MTLQEDIPYLTFRAMAQGRRTVSYPPLDRKWDLDDKADREDLREFVQLALRQVANRMYYGNLFTTQLEYLEKKLI